MKKKFRLPRSARGQSLVEMAISLVILLWLLSGAAEFAIALFQYIQLRDAAQEGALYGSVYPGDANAIIARARNASASPLNLQDAGIVDVDVFVDDHTTPAIDDIAASHPDYADFACEGNGIKVVATYDHRIFMPFMAQILQTDFIRLRAEVIDTILTPPPTASGTCP